LEHDIAEAMCERHMHPEWTARSLALHTQGVIQGAFILAKATGSAEIAAESIDHLRRYVEALFAKKRDSRRRVITRHPHNTATRTNTATRANTPSRTTPV